MPIQRHAALAPLSRDHHLALLLARGVQSGASPHLRASLPSAPRALAAHVCDFYDEHLAPHFAEEEALVVAAARGRSAELDALCTEIEAEHAQIRTVVDGLRGAGERAEPVGTLIDQFGRLLEAHVRKEERSLYQGVQEALDEGALLALGAKLEARRHARP